MWIKPAKPTSTWTLIVSCLYICCTLLIGFLESRAFRAVDELMERLSGRLQWLDSAVANLAKVHMLCERLQRINVVV